MVRHVVCFVVLCASLTAPAAGRDGLARADGAARLSTVDVEGRLLEPKERLLRFLGLSPGLAYDSTTEQSVIDLTQKLGYRVLESRIDQGPSGLSLRLRLEPMRVVRNTRVYGNGFFTLFDDEILRYLSIRPGATLPPDAQVNDFLADEESRVLGFLQRDGWYGGAVKLELRRANCLRFWLFGWHQSCGDHEEWVDVDVRLSLGKWYRLGAIVTTGESALSDKEIYDAFDHCSVLKGKLCGSWGRFNVQRMREDTREAERVLRRRGYPEARIRPSFDLARDLDPRSERIILPVEVAQKRRVEVRFLGNRQALERDLRDQLTIFEAGSLDDIELAESARSLHRYYQQHGYFESVVSFQRGRLTPTVEEAVFVIDEGPELRVRRVDFASENGRALSFSGSELAEKADLGTKVFPRLGLIGLGEGGYVTSVQLQQDVERLIELYHLRGFPNVRVRAEVARAPNALGAAGVLGATVAVGSSADRDLYVRFYIDEGRHELVDHIEVSWSGAHTQDERAIYGVLQLTTGNPYTENAFADDRKRLVDLYGNAGRPYAEISYAGTTWNAAHDRITVRYAIDEGPEVELGEILVRGNFKTRDWVVRRDLAFRAGDKFTLKRLQDAELNLQSHLIFNVARVTPLFGSKRSPVPVLVQVQERAPDMGVPSFGIGVSTDQRPNDFFIGPYTYGRYTYSNVFGLGSQLEARADIGWRIQSGTLRYTDLRIFGPGWGADLSGFVRQELSFRLGPITTFGLSAVLTRLITPALRLIARYDLYLSQLQVGFYRNDGPADRATQQDNTITSKLSLKVLWDRRVGQDGLPNQLMPVKGWLLSGQATGASRYFGGDNDFLVFSGQALGILPIPVRGRVFTLIANLRYDHGVPIGSPALPAVERFFAGGDTATRGYEPDQLKTEIVRTQVAPLPGRVGFQVLPQGGNIRMLSTIELQFPISKLFGMPWVGAVFYDVGAVVDAVNFWQPGDFKHAVGATLLRILTPFGPLSLEYAYPLSQGLAEERWKNAPWYQHYPGRFHFNFGIPLR